MYAKKSLGQNFLLCAWVIDELLSAAEIKNTDIILEIGPGTGVLTRPLAHMAKKVIAVEKDERLAAKLADSLKKEGISNVEIVPADILDLLKSDFHSLNYKLSTKSYKLIGNIPYYLTSRLLRLIFEQTTLPEKIALTVQKEVSERIIATPPDMSILGISVQVFGKPSVIKTIPSSCFYPKPNVNQAILAISGISDDFFKKNKLNKENFFSLIKLGFSQKRKKLSNNLRGLISSAIIADLKIPINARAEELSLGQWVKILRAIKP